MYSQCTTPHSTRIILPILNTHSNPILIIYSGTPLLWTRHWGPGKLSCIESCPHFCGKFVLRKQIWDIAQSVLNTEVSIFQGRPLRGIPLYSHCTPFDCTSSPRPVTPPPVRCLFPSPRGAEEGRSASGSTSYTEVITPGGHGSRALYDWGIHNYLCRNNVL